MADDRARIERVIEAFERSDWSEIDVRVGDVRVHLVADGRAPTEHGSPAPRHEAAKAPDHTELTSSADSNQPVPAGSHVVVAPSPGVFWRAPEPGAPPFCEVGQRVEPETTLCIIEVMKLMSHLKAGVAGTVTAIQVGDGETVAKDQALFAIDVTAP